MERTQIQIPAQAIRFGNLLQVKRIKGKQSTLSSEKIFILRTSTCTLYKKLTNSEKTL